MSQHGSESLSGNQTDMAGAERTREPRTGAWAFRRDLPAAQIELLGGGHFVMDTRLDEVARLTAHFLQAHKSALCFTACFSRCSLVRAVRSYATANCIG